MELNDFQGVVVINLDEATKTLDIINKILNKNVPPEAKIILNTPCYDLNLSNKYYSTTVNLFEGVCLDKIVNNETDYSTLLEHSEAIIIYVDGTKVTQTQLDDCLKNLDQVCGEPRILLYHSIDEDCESFKGLQSWCIDNHFDYIQYSSEETDDEILNSLSSYKWSKLKLNDESNNSNNLVQQPVTNDILKQIQDFDQLLKDINSYQENPEEATLTNIAKRMSMLLGE